MYLFMFNKMRKLKKIGYELVSYTSDAITLTKNNKKIWFKVDYSFDKKTYYVVDFKAI